jgi:hypothetical protein
MSAGTRWQLPGGHQALEIAGSTRECLRVCVIVANWPFPKPPQDVPRKLCTALPSRYLKGAVPPEDCEEALL